MGGVLEGSRVIEVSMWAYVPSAGAALAEWGADVIKIEGPDGDPVRNLVTAGVEITGPRYTWEMWNRGKRAIALDLRNPEAQRILHRLVREADVFLTSVLPDARSKLGIDLDSIRSANPGIVYAAGTASGPLGPDAARSGYDQATFWSRGGMAEAVTPSGSDPIGMPAPAFGDAVSGLALAGGIAAALVKKARTGEGSVVEGALFGTALWAMQMSLVSTAASGLDEMPRGSRLKPFNPLVNTYPTADDRWVALNMMQQDRFWAGLCVAIGRPDLVADPRFVDTTARVTNIEECVAELEKTFRSQPLDHWRKQLSTQEGTWEILNKVSELVDDPQVKANGYAQVVDYGEGHTLPLVATPIQFDRTPPTLGRAPDYGGDTDAVLESIGWLPEAITEARIRGAVI
jgi:crotonobetainyl-CoA:carnitine CoA-transferase CaiB-like acyl-CoA transferase